jgi:hypothetical protein
MNMIGEDAIMTFYEFNVFSSAFSMAFTSCSLHDNALMPQACCRICGWRPAAFDAFAVPETQTLSADHPVLHEIKRLNKQVHDAQQPFAKRFFRLAIERKLPPSNDHCWQDEFIGYLEPAELTTIADALRNTLDLPVTRDIFPLSRLGLKHVRCAATIPDWGDVQDSSLLMSARALQVITEAQLTGWQAFPVVLHPTARVIKQGVPVVHELLVTGQAGPPVDFIEGRDYQRCAACGNLTGTTYADTFTVNEQNWDGTDFFHVARRGVIIITERAKQVLEAARFKWIGFRPTTMPRREWRLSMGFLG